MGDEQVVNEWLRSDQVMKEGGDISRPCLFDGTPSPSDVCQVHVYLFKALLGSKRS